MASEPPNANGKRCRSPTFSMGWAEYDADLLDNVRTTKRFARQQVDVDMASELTSKMTMMTAAQSPVKSVNNTRPATSGAPEAMSVEASPAITPKVASISAAQWPPASTEPPGAHGWTTPRRPISSLGPMSSVNVADRSMTSPSDPQVGDPQLEKDLRKVTLRKILMMRGNTSAVAPSSSSAMQVEDIGSSARNERRQQLPSPSALPSHKQGRLQQQQEQHQQEASTVAKNRKNKSNNAGSMSTHRLRQ